jgi:hypothetical protein
MQGLFRLLVVKVGFKNSLAEKQKLHLPKVKAGCIKTFGEAKP